MARKKAALSNWTYRLQMSCQKQSRPQQDAQQRAFRLNMKFQCVDIIKLKFMEHASLLLTASF
jgi:hypothetical protein